jgi:uncharacterized protein YgiM (DUF1202 family)
MLLGFWATVMAETLTVTRRSKVRQSPSPDASALTTVPKGTAFPLLATAQGWYQIQLDDGRQGWMAASDVQVQAGARGASAAGRALSVVGSKASPAAGSSPRQALIIGNATYRVSPLQNPVNDATAMAETLRQAGFEVTLLKDATLREMVDAARAFGQSLQRGGVALFYYAGHGLQVKGENYLVPVDANIQAEGEVEFETMHIGRVLSAIEEANAAVNLVILDACRDNPFRKAGRSLGRGLAPVQAAHGTLIAYATAPGDVAEDGSGSNGVYTKHLLHNIRTPGMKVEDVFKHVRIEVRQETNGRQTPWESSSLTGDFYFTSSGGREVVAAVPPPPPPVPVTPPPSASPPPSPPPARLAGESVTVEGLAIVRQNQVSSARDQAMQDAQAKALQQAIERSVGAATATQHYAQLERQIYIQPQRYVLQTRSLQEQREGNKLRVTVEAVLDTGKLSQDLAAMGLSATPQAAQQARVMVLIAETQGGYPSSDSASETAIIQELLNSGFQVVAVEQSRGIRSSAQGKKALSGDTRTLQHLGQQHGADLLIVGSASSEVAMRGGQLGPLVSARAHLDARVVRIATADVVVAGSQEASGVDIAELTAGKTALTEAGKQWVEQHRDTLMQWR